MLFLIIYFIGIVMTILFINKNLGFTQGYEQKIVLCLIWPYYMSVVIIIKFNLFIEWIEKGLDNENS